MVLVFKRAYDRDDVAAMSIVFRQFSQCLALIHAHSAKLAFEADALGGPFLGRGVDGGLLVGWIRW